VKKTSIGKKFLGLAMALVMILGSLSGVYAATTTNEITVTVDGQRVIFEGQGPVIVDGRTLVPVRGVFEHLGFTVGWNGDDRVATMTRDSDTIVITIGSAAFTTNGVNHTLDVPGQIINGRTLVPIRFPLESVGYNLAWDGSTRTAIITSGGSNPNTGTTPPAVAEGIRIVQDSFIITATSAHGSQMWVTPEGQVGGGFGIIYDLTKFEDTMMRYGNSMAEFNNPDVVPQIDAMSRGLNSRNLRFAVHQVGTATIDVWGQFLPREQGAQITITVAHTPAHAVATANGDGVHLTSRMFLSQNEIQSMLPFARQSVNTMPAIPHPNRVMTEVELQAWIGSYNELGGINAFELEVLYLLNNIRAEHNLQPFSLCPRLSMAARLHTQLMREFDFIGHEDPLYGSAGDRGLFFDVLVASENAGAGASTPENRVRGWMSSPGHRQLILASSMTHVGIGNIGVWSTMKVS